jgi:hypothetical protein
MFAVPDPSFVLKDTVGEMYFCTRFNHLALLLSRADLGWRT